MNDQLQVKDKFVEYIHKGFQNYDVEDPAKEKLIVELSIVH